MTSSARKRTVRRQRLRSSWTTSWTGWNRARRGAAERGLALLEERGDALGEVVGLDELALREGLGLELLLERRRLRRVEQPLRLPHRARRHRRKELAPPRRRACGELVVGDELRDEAPVQRLAGGRWRPVTSHSNARPAPSSRAGEPGGAGVRREADAREAGHEDGRVGRDPRVAGEREREPGARGVPVHRGETGFSSARIASTSG